MGSTRKTFYLYLLATLMAYCVIVLGAYVRLSDAGLGCPDWPGCYGNIFVPEERASIEQANQAYPERPLEQAKAWKEMVHRYIAGVLGLLILFIAIRSWRTRQNVVASTFLLGFVVFQAVLGMWTVTLLLKPVIVTSHLLGGMTILGLLHWLVLRQTHPPAFNANGFLPFAILGLVVVTGQIILGGWTSANYAALICPEFPTCRAGEWFPSMNFEEGFRLWRGLGIDYEGGILDPASRTAIHISHRIGAAVTFLIVAGVSLRAILEQQRELKVSSVLTLIVLLLQLSLGIANIIFVLPLPVAVAHNGVAALLLLCMVTMVYYSLVPRSG